MKRRKFVIIGAGPTGLGAALRLQELSIDDFVVVDSATHAGGLASSFVDDAGFTWDLGSHIQHSHYEKFDQYMDLALTADEWLRHQRTTWIWQCHRFVPYPFQLNLHRLPKTEMSWCVDGLIAASKQPHKEPNNFREWLLATFGRGICELFMFPYNEKVWARPAAELAHSWVADRVAMPVLDQMPQHDKVSKDCTSWGPNAQFRYPKRGGTGAIWNQLSARLPSSKMCFGQSIVAVDRHEKVAFTSSGEQFHYQHLISTMPLDRLATITNPSGDFDQASLLKKNKTHVIGFGLVGQPPDSLQDQCWGYYPQEDIPFYRLTVMSNLSPENTPDPGRHWSLMAEAAESEFVHLESDVVSAVEQAMQRLGLIYDQKHIRSRWHTALEHGYPVPCLRRDKILSQVLPTFASDAIYSRGRFGAWKYEVSNQDHSFMQGFEVIDHILFGQPERTLHDPNFVNSRYNPFPIPVE